MLPMIAAAIAATFGPAKSASVDEGLRPRGEAPFIWPRGRRSGSPGQMIIPLPDPPPEGREILRRGGVISSGGCGHFRGDAADLARGRARVPGPPPGVGGGRRALRLRPSQTP